MKNVLEICGVTITNPQGEGILTFDVGKKVYTINMEIIYWALRLRDYKKALNRGTTVIDGHWVYLLLRLKYGKIPLRKAPGSRLIFRLLEEVQRNKVRTLIVGASNEIFEKVRNKFPDAPLFYFDPGEVPLDPRREREKIESIGNLILELKPSVVIIALGPPKQELLIDALSPYLEKGGVGLAIGVGGALKMVAGVEKRAPDIIYNLGLEWAWRLLQDPKRIRKVARSVAALACALTEVTIFRLRELKNHIFPQSI
ncbi:hypothetical protein EYM_00270 [Ignicoccus islandicus DSM 13165]|uniref:Glycosyltransferase n=1 Tax=Ignicoccus islandicus DSM 13165 TaxID=940295 RepID=A0A0U3FJN8_9CREN|nr:WecB/TagA/CpsF family glycosyltransferase [Ignicoccus islandicus]ALU12102.1 hypothetical protein EYM_00270 [Ignicoccus islandicus DSM 13165]